MRIAREKLLALSVIVLFLLYPTPAECYSLALALFKLWRYSFQNRFIPNYFKASFASTQPPVLNTLRRNKDSIFNAPRAFYKIPFESETCQALLLPASKSKYPLSLLCTCYILFVIIYVHVFEEPVQSMCSFRSSRQRDSAFPREVTRLLETVQAELFLWEQGP